MKKAAVICLLPLLLTAIEVPSATMKQEGKKSFQKHKALEEESHERRIEILKKADECIKNAATPQAYKECERREKEDRIQLKERQQSQHEALKQERMEMRKKVYPRGTIDTH